ncbi:unnamed protein product (macronuclear) [Paramecium tetraurelia]|uniref:Uncharacterized protein n=1 Tax=Paramecium tetraurelia TaxID=5888 RepID=A0D4J5_PARTE|nr:uncharacterized protein GSPATT00013428001 [Paramecium tetraurelia]CAK77962.1 unnamed protein product [Paramecium tetraurelia]|eukprot:XP_001445359.1 hypothetical protein (macronuclear) [Paramecium tetraurelia strain d4-2]
MLSFDFLLKPFDQFDQWIMNSIKVLNISEDKVRLVSYFLFCIPIAIIFSKIKQQRIRLIYNIFWGVFFTLFLGREWFVYINITTILVYFISTIPTKNVVIPISITAFVALSYVHLFRQWFDYLSWKIDFSVIQMTITCRLIYYAVDLQYGKAYDTGFWTYYSYIFSFFSIMIGPVPYHNYLNFLNQKEEYSNIKFNQYKSVITNLIKALLFCAGEIWIRPYVDYDWYDSPQWNELNLIEKNLLQAIIGLVARMRYFAGFKFTQAAMDAAGITYNEDTQQFDKFITCDYSYEKDVSAIHKTTKWNTTVQIWLKYCFFDKFSTLFDVTTAYYMTYGISALWHGFYLGYYQTFFWWALINQNCKYVYRSRDKFQWIPAPLRSIIAFTYCTFTMNQIAMTMGLLDWDKGMRFNNSMYWSGPIAILIVFFFFFLTQYGQKRRK